jgi:hypothetical protein
MKKITIMLLGLSMSTSAFAGVTMNCYEKKGVMGAKEKLFETSDFTSADEIDLADAVGTYTGRSIHGQRQFHLSISAEGMDGSNVYMASNSIPAQMNPCQNDQSSSTSSSSSSMDQITSNQSAQMNQGSCTQSNQATQTDFNQSCKMDKNLVTCASSTNGPKKIEATLVLENSGVHKDSAKIKSGHSKKLYFTFLDKGDIVKIKCKVGYTR